MVNYCKSAKCLIGKAIIVTGANTGIGFEAALDFAKRGARVILACRNKSRADAARQQIVNATGNDNILVKLIDFESLDSVREFARDIIASEPRLDVLLNNAGAANLSERLTADGLQLEMQVNYFGPFLLTNLLLDLLKKSAPSRIVNVSSYGAIFTGKLNPDKLNEVSGSMLYARSKLCNILFTMELAKRLEGTDVTTYSLHPGAVHTDFQRFSSVLGFVAKKCFKTAEEGAQTSIYLSLEDGLEQYNGRHFHDCKPVKTYCNARDPELPKKLWEVTEELIGMKND